MNKEIEEIINDLCDDHSIFLNYYNEDDFYGLPEIFEDPKLLWWHGADKVVVDAEDSVIKIPIRGDYLFIGDGDFSETDINKFLKKGFIEIVPDVIVRQDKTQNSCERELDIYKKACEFHLEKFFAAEKEYNKDIIIQEKVITDFTGDNLSIYDWEHSQYYTQIMDLEQLR